jgi:hypothetical protein
MSKTMKLHDNIFDEFLRGDTDVEAAYFIEGTISQIDRLMRDITGSTDKRLLTRWKQRLESHIKRIETQLAGGGGGA